MSEKPHQALSHLPKSQKAADLFLARATALKEYSQYEISLHNLFAYLMGTTPDYAGVVFFRINNARARIAALERMLKKRCGSKYNLFWNSLVQPMRDLDETRNWIVHWALMSTLETGKSGETNLRLIPPNFWDRNENTPDLTISDIYDFIVKTDFYARSLNVFHAVLLNQGPPTWREICAQPVVYPPPANHPLAPKT